MSTSNSISHLMEQFLELNTNSLETFERINEAITSDKQTVTINMYDGDTDELKTIQLPSFGYLKRELDRLDRNVSSITGLESSSANLRLKDGTYRRINGYKRHDSNCHFEIQSPVPMRVAPSPTLSDGGLFTNFQSTFTATQSSPTIGEWNGATGQGLLQVQSTWSSTHANIPSWEGYQLQLACEL